MSIEIPTQTAPKELKTPSKLRKWLKRIGWTVLGVLVVLWAIGTFARGAVDKFDSRFFVNWVMERRQVAYDKELKKLEDKYRNDFDGGKTPEETLELLIVALKAGDVEKASKYWVLEKQGEAFHDFKNELAKYGDSHLSIKYFTEVPKKGTKWCNEKKNECVFEYKYIRTETSTTTTVISGETIVVVSPEGSEGRKIVDMGLNRLSGVWKIELP